LFLAATNAVLNHSARLRVETASSRNDDEADTIVDWRIAARVPAIKRFARVALRHGNRP
jgi:hypothetical protein